MFNKQAEEVKENANKAIEDAKAKAELTMNYVQDFAEKEMAKVGKTVRKATKIISGVFVATGLAYLTYVSIGIYKVLHIKDGN